MYSVTTCLLILATGLACPALMLAEAAGALRGTEVSQIMQNKRADADDLSRMKDVAMIRRFARAKLLVPVPVRTSHYYLRSIPAAYRYLRPWSKLFLDRLSSQFHARFRKKLRVTSLVRSMAYQRALARRNGNAAAAYGERRSSHLTGATLDISKRFMKREEQSWMRRVLVSLKSKGYLYAIEERYQPTFHIMVYRNYPEYVAVLQRRRR
jgi:hypothetical protein